MNTEHILNQLLNSSCNLLDTCIRTMQVTQSTTSSVVNPHHPVPARKHSFSITHRASYCTRLGQEQIKPQMQDSFYQL